jgi:phytoene dehydrogenase-like protein
VKYTGRYKGLVGGIPHSLKRNPISYLIGRSPYRNFYMLGDTQYPGQGIASVVLGAQNLSKYLSE